MQHVEFFQPHHFETRYFRVKAKKTLSRFIDFFWETDFESLLQQYPEGFSDALFPNVGYTYLINLGTPFVMQLESNRFEMKGDGFLPRHQNMICHHSTSNQLFGIKFKVSPILFQKKINFSEYREYIYPLSYLIDREIIDAVKKSPSFDERVSILSEYYETLVKKHAGSMKPVDIVTSIIRQGLEEKRFHLPVEQIAANHGVSTRTLQRYFEATTSISSKQALQILRIRAAIEDLVSNPKDFDPFKHGYYDHSHFYRHLKQFLNSPFININKPHVKLLQIYGNVNREGE